MVAERDHAARERDDAARERERVEREHDNALVRSERLLAKSAYGRANVAAMSSAPLQTLTAPSRAPHTANQPTITQ